MNLVLLQAAADTVAAADTPRTASISFFELIMKGGPVMIPIIILNIVAFYILIERFITISKARKIDSSFMANLKDQILSGNMNGARTLCERTDSPIARILGKGVARLGKPLEEISSGVESMGNIEVSKMERNMGFLGIIAGVAPMLGFIGTIAGIINIFYTIATTGNLGVDTISEGLYQKMITSGAGLLVGMIAYAGYHLLNLMIDKFIFRMESAVVEFMDILQAPSK